MAELLIEVLIGSDRVAATSQGDQHFSQHPAVGDHVDIEDKAFIVREAWHKPSPFFKGSKFAVLLDESGASATG